VIAAPLYGLTRKDVEFAWTEECREALLKERLMDSPILALPRDQRKYILDTYASVFGLGAVLSQEQDEFERGFASSPREP